MSCMSCKKTYKSESIEIDSAVLPSKLVMVFTDLTAVENLECLKLITCQPIPVASPPVPVVIKIGATEYLVQSSSGNVLQSDQLKAVSTCSCACNPSYTVVYGNNPDHFQFLDNLLPTIV